MERYRIWIRLEGLQAHERGRRLQEESEPVLVTVTGRSVDERGAPIGSVVTEDVRMEEQALVHVTAALAAEVEVLVPLSTTGSSGPPVRIDLAGPAFVGDCAFDRWTVPLRDFAEHADHPAAGVRHSLYGLVGEDDEARAAFAAWARARDREG